MTIECKQCSVQFEKPYNLSSTAWKIRMFCGFKCSSLFKTGKKQDRDVVEKRRQGILKANKDNPDIIKRRSMSMKEYYAKGGTTVLGKKWQYTPEQLARRAERQKGKGNNNYRHGKTPQLYKLVSKTPEHRLIMEKVIGRKLKDIEVVHHWDENKRNNKLENLALLRSDSAHMRLHHFARRHNIPVEQLKFKQDWLIT